jgi:hypothetical protein
MTIKARAIAISMSDITHGHSPSASLNHAMQELIKWASSEGGDIKDICIDEDPLHLTMRVAMEIEVAPFQTTQATAHWHGAVPPPTVSKTGVGVLTAMQLEYFKKNLSGDLVSALCDESSEYDGKPLFVHLEPEKTDKPSGSIDESSMNEV